MGDKKEGRERQRAKDETQTSSPMLSWWAEDDNKNNRGKKIGEERELEKKNKAKRHKNDSYLVPGLLISHWLIAINLALGQERAQGICRYRI